MEWGYLDEVRARFHKKTFELMPEGKKETAMSKVWGRMFQAKEPVSERTV